MAASHTLRTLASLGSLTLLTAITLTDRSSIAPLLHLFSPTAHPTHFALLLIFLYLNAKSLPLAWHIRLARITLRQLYFQRRPLPPDALFRPIITTGFYTPIAECDYNLHKSNSTYFSDLDMARTQLASCILRKGILSKSAHERGSVADDEKVWRDYHELLASEDRRANPDAPAMPVPPPPPKRGQYVIYLGAASCHFKKEIKPYERFDIWTRVLSWDRKWLYMVSTVVKAGTVVPEGWALQPWKNQSGRLRRKREEVDARKREESNGHSTSLPGDAEREAEYKNAIFASSIAKYVVKKGRYTIPPEIVLRNSTLLPPRPGLETTAREKQVEAKAPEWWTWEVVDRERRRGGELARHYAALDGNGGLHDEFPASKGMEGGMEVLGEFKDLWF